MLERSVNLIEYLKLGIWINDAYTEDGMNIGHFMYIGRD